MKKVLLTAIGCPGAYSIAKLLQDDYELYGVEASGKKCGAMEWVNEYKTVPHVSHVGDEEYVEEMQKCVVEWGIDYILPMSTAELTPLSRYKDYLRDCKVLVSENEDLDVVIDKGKLYEYFKDHGNGFTNHSFIPKFKVCKTHDEANTHIGWSDEDKLFVKPCRGNGSRGLYAIVDYPLHLNFDFKQPPYQVISRREFYEGEAMDWGTDLLVSEFLVGQEWSVDCVVYDEGSVIVCRQRLGTRGGICTEGNIIEHKKLEELCAYILGMLPGLRYNINMQFIETNEGFKLIEINPRVSGTIVLSSQKWNLPKMALLLAEGGWGKVVKEELKGSGKGYMVREFQEFFY